MARITVAAASKQFKYSRPTIYKKINQGLLTLDEDKLLDVNDCIRVLTPVKSKTSTQLTSVKPKGTNELTVLTVQVEAQEKEIQNLKQQIQMLQSQLEHSRASELWLKQQVELQQQKRITNKSGLLGRLFG